MTREDMTKEEAIEIINRENDPNDTKVWELFPEYREALDMAIQALSQEPCTDAVSRDAVREILTKYHLGESRIAEELNELSSVQRKSNADEKHIGNTLEDAISREEAIKAIKESAESPSFRGFMAMEQYMPEDAIEAIRNLLSVTQKSGKWIRVTDKTGHLVWECDKCGWQQRLSNNFCPDCGAKMERSDKE